jgi:hypothetical protein
MKRILFHTGGPWHPVAAQIALIQTWLPADWRIEAAFGATVFDRLDEADLFVSAGMHWPELEKPQPDVAWELAGVARHGYTPPTDAQKGAFRRFVASGRPLLAFHGGILTYEDWPEFGRLLGFRWHWGYTGHSKYGEYPVKVSTDTHPVVAGVRDFRIHDELYFNVILPPEMAVGIHAKAQFADWVEFPMVLTAEGPAGRCAGAGRTAYLANGHSMESMEPPAIRQLWLNTLHWLFRE